MFGNLKAMRLALEDPNNKSGVTFEARDFSIIHKKFELNHKEPPEYEFSWPTKVFIGQLLQNKTLNERAQVFNLLIEAILKEVNSWTIGIAQEKNYHEFNQDLINSITNLGKE